MNHLEILRIFGVAAVSESFRQAARQLGVSPQAVTRAVAQLETTLGEPLFHRTSRQIRLTAFGEQLVTQAANAVASVDAVFQRVHGAAHSTAAGVVRIAVPGSLGRRCVIEALAPTLLANPGLLLDVRVSDQLADAVDDKIDVGVRIGRMKDSSFIAKRATALPFFVAAAPALIQRTFEPTTIEDLLYLPISALIDRNTGRAWPWVFKAHRQLQPISTAFVTDDPESECSAVVAGLAFGQLAAHLALPWMRQGRLVTVLNHLEPDPWPVVVYRPRRAPTPLRVRRVFDALVSALGEQRWLPTQR
jgi:DNA-binding transcriptional LysR family regulator